MYKALTYSFSYSFPVFLTVVLLKCFDFVGFLLKCHGVKAPEHLSEHRSIALHFFIMVGRSCKIFSRSPGLSKFELRYIFIFALTFTSATNSGIQSSSLNILAEYTNESKARENLDVRTIETPQYINEQLDETLDVEDAILTSEKLRDKGVLLISKQDYGGAIQCYGAALQLLNGLGGAYILELRFRYGMTLAGCFFKLRKFEDAIIAYTDVIEEAPITSVSKDSTVDNSDLIGLTLSKAYYQRGLSFLALKKSSLAVQDMKMALEFSNTLKEAITEQLNTTLKSILPSSGAGGGLEVDLDSPVVEDLVEDMRLRHPKLTFSLRKINSIINPAKQPNRMIGAESSPFSGFLPRGLENATGSAAVSTINPLQSILSPTSGLFSSLTSGKNGSFSLAQIRSSVRSLLPLLGPLAGLDRPTVQLAGEIVEAFLDVGAAFSKVLLFTKNHFTSLCIGITLIAILYSLFL